MYISQHGIYKALFFSPVIHSFKKFSHTYFVSGNMLRSRHIMVNKTDTGSIHGAYILVGNEATSEHK